jgi:3D (Asp-Asp-Asp) domain-containing protein
MNILRNTMFVTPKARTALAVLAMAVAFTSTNVQAAQASETLPVPTLFGTEVQVSDDVMARGITVPEDPPAPKAVEAPKPKPAKKVWNTVNAPDLETKPEQSDEPAARTMTVPVSAYTSAVAECDSTPFTTANGSQVRDGIVAANFLKFGTRFRIPEYFGNKVFEVHDRMNARYQYRIDIWMLKKADARAWGVRNVKIEILP